MDIKLAMSVGISMIALVSMAHPTWTGPIDNTWSTSGNWTTDGKPSSAGSNAIIQAPSSGTTLDVDETVPSLLYLNVQNNNVTFSGNPLTLRYLVSYVDVTFNNAIGFTGDNDVYISPMEKNHPVVFNGAVTIPGNQLTIKGYSHIVFNALVYGSSAVVKLGTESVAARITFNEAVEFDTIDATGSFWTGGLVFNATGNQWNALKIGRDPVACGVAGALPENSVIQWLGTYGTTCDLGGKDQTVNRLITDDVGNNDCAKLTSTGAAVLTLKPTESATAYCCLQGGVSLVLDAVDTASTQTLLNRTHSTTGSIAVCGGTLDIGGTSVFSSVPTLSVAGGKLKISGSEKAFPAVTAVLVGNGAVLDVSEASVASPFTASNSDLTLEDGACVSLAPSSELTFAHVITNGVSLPNGTYRSTDLGSFISGSGVIRVTEGGEPPARSVVWTAGGADDATTANPANWSGTPGADAVATFATDGSQALLSQDLSLRGVVFDLPQSNAFTIANAPSAQDAKLQIGADGVTGVAGKNDTIRRYEISSPIHFDGVPAAALTWQGAGSGSSWLRLTGPISSANGSVALTHLGGGSLRLESAESTFSGSFSSEGGWLYLTGGSLGAAGNDVKITDAKANAYVHFMGGTYAQDVSVSVNRTGSNQVQFHGDCRFDGRMTFEDRGWGLLFALKSAGNQWPESESAANVVFAGGIAQEVTGWKLDFKFYEGSKMTITDNPIVKYSDGLVRFNAIQASELDINVPWNIMPRVFIGGPLTVKVNCDNALSATETAGTELILGKYEYETGKSVDGFKIDLCGHDLRVGKVSGDTETGVVTSGSNAVVRVQQNSGGASTTLGLSFQGGAGLVKAGSDELVLSGVSSTTGRLEVVSGRLVLGNAATWSKARNVTLSGGTLALTRSESFCSRSDLCILGSGTMNIPQGVTQTCRRLFIDGSDLPAGCYGGANSPVPSACRLAFLGDSAGVLKVSGTGLVLMVR